MKTYITITTEKASYVAAIDGIQGLAPWFDSMIGRGWTVDLHEDSCALTVDAECDCKPYRMSRGALA